MRELKVVFVGDSGCGKTSQIRTFSKKGFDDIHRPTTGFETSTSNVQFNGKNVTLEIWDFVGDENYDRFRGTFLYSQTSPDAIIICFSLSSFESLKNVWDKWYPEVKHYFPSVPVVLVGNKKDLRDAVTANEQTCLDDTSTSICSDENVEQNVAQFFADKIKAFDYVECSAFTGDGIDEVFEKVAEASLWQVILEDMEDPMSFFQSEEGRKLYENSLKNIGLNVRILNWIAAFRQKIFA